MIFIWFIKLIFLFQSFTKSLNIYHHPYLTSAAYVNMATILKRQCVKDINLTYSVPLPIYGTYICDQTLITDFIYHLRVLLRVSMQEFCFKTWIFYMLNIFYDIWSYNSIIMSKSTSISDVWAPMAKNCHLQIISKYWKRESATNPDWWSAFQRFE